MCFSFGSGRKGAQLRLKNAFPNSCGLCPPQGLENSLKNGIFLPILAMEQLYLLCHSSEGTLPSPQLLPFSCLKSGLSRLI